MKRKKPFVQKKKHQSLSSDRRFRWQPSMLTHKVPRSYHLFKTSKKIEKEEVRR